MIGSNFFKIISKNLKVESFMTAVLLFSSLAFAIPLIFTDVSFRDILNPSQSNLNFVASKNEYAIFGGFVLFEVCVGIFWPAMSYMREQYVPETGI
jgi:hypothetical protein